MGRPKSIYSSATARKFVGTKDAAAILGVSVSTVHKMLTEGKLHAWKTNGGHRRIDIEDLRKMAGALEVPPSVAVASDTARVRSEQHEGPLRILVVEDNPSVAKGVGKVLERFGPRVQATITSDAAEALMKIAESPPNLVVTDLIMKPFDGFHLLKILRSSPRYSDIHVMVVTGISDAEIANRGGVDPGVLVYHKPLHPERLAGFVDAMLLRRH